MDIFVNASKCGILSNLLYVKVATSQRRLLRAQFLQHHCLVAL